MRFEIEPYEGATPIRFGMSEADVLRILGDPEHAGTDSSGYRNYTYGGPLLSVGFAKEDGGVNHVAVSADVEVVFRGLNVFEPGAFEQMCKPGGRPMEYHGSIMLLELGIGFNGFTSKEDVLDCDEESEPYTVPPLSGLFANPSPGSNRRSRTRPSATDNADTVSTITLSKPEQPADERNLQLGGRPDWTGRRYTP